MNIKSIEKLLQVVPQEAGEAYEKFPFIEAFMPRTDSHEWDNRTTIENAIWLLGLLTKDREMEFICPICCIRRNPKNKEEITF